MDLKELSAKDGLKRFAYWLSTQNQKQRMVTLSVLLGCIGLLWYILFFAPSYQIISEQNDKIKSAQTQIDAINKRTLALTNMANDPANLQARIALQQQLAEIDKKLEHYKRQLILPGQMLTALKTIITNENDLTLKQLSNLPPQPIRSDSFGEKTAESAGNNPDKNKNPDENELASPPVILYKHRFTIEFEGNYFSTLDYMQKLEQLPWRLYWDNVNYRVIKYPKASVILTLYTISTQRDLLDV